jgi:hypothetical protein
MEWRLYDINGEFLQRVNCEYDACDIARWEYRADEIQLDFKWGEAYITKKGELE